MLTAEDAKRRAVTLAGFDDFGPEGWREGLEHSLAAFAELPLTDSARAAAEAKLIADLANRLRIERHWRDNAEVRAQQVEGPIVVVGLPRTGTTATVAMMALDPRFRFLRAWEANQPLPPPVLESETHDLRVLAARAAASGYANQAQHLHDPDGPEEDLAMLAGLDMHAYHGAYPMPDWYSRWWIEAPFASTYAMHAKTLQVLHSRRPPHLWLLKSPPHLFHLEALAAQYPNARFIMTHRDPAKVIASVSSLHRRLHAERCRSEALEPERYGPKYLAFWREGMERALAARARIGENRFLDVRNHDVVERPLETFEAIYAFLGMELDCALRARLDAYTAVNARGAFGEHRYTAEEYGTSAAEIREAFRGYVKRFDL